MRVLILADNPYFGGPTTHILALLDAARTHRPVDYQLAVFPGRNADRTLIDRAHDSGLDVHELPMAHTYDLNVISHLRSLVSSLRPDLVHAHGYRGTLIGARAIRGGTLITTSHGVIVGAGVRTRVWEWAAIRAMRRHPVTVACSDFVREWLIEHHIPAARVVTVHNGYAPPGFVKPVPRKALGIPQNHLGLFYAGRLVAGKGLETLITALAGLDGVGLAIAGDGPLRAELELRAVEQKAAVTFLGRVSPIEPYYAAADVAVLPSDMEAMPMALVEAAALGLPAVASAAGGIPEIVVDGETGYLTQPGDAGALRAALLKCRDASTRKKLGKNARKRWETHFKPGTMLDDLTAVYQRALGSSEPSTP